MKKSLATTKTFILIGTFSILALLIIVVFAVWPKKETKPQSQTLPSVSDSTANWKVYQNERYGFEVRYPSSLDITYKIVDLIIWQYPQDTGYDSPRLSLEIEKRDSGNTNIPVYLKEKYGNVGQNSFVKVVGLPKTTRSGLKYFYNKLISGEDGSEIEKIYFVINPTIVSLSSGLDPQTFLYIIESISFTN